MPAGAQAGELLLRLLSTRPGAGARVPPLPEAAWQAVVRESVRHRVAALLYRRLRDAAVSVPAPMLEQLEIAYLLGVAQTGAVRRQLPPVVDALGAAGVRVIVLKGLYLGEHVYGDAALRPLADLDVMVPPHAVATAERVLATLGYARTVPAHGDPDYETHHHVRPFVAPARLRVDLHRHVTDGAGAPRIDVERLWERATPTRVAGVDVLTLSPEDLILHLSIHAAYNHRFAVPLCSVCDVAASVEQLSGRLDWDLLAASARAAGAEPLVRCVLRLAVAMLGGELPAGALAAGGGDPADDEMPDLIRPYILFAADDLPPRVRQLRESRGLAGKARAAARAVFPPLPEMRRAYGLPAGSPAAYRYYAVRPVELLVRHGRTLLDIVAGRGRVGGALDRDARRLRIERWLASQLPERAGVAPGAEE